MQDARLAGRLHKELKMLQDPPPGVCVWPADEHSLTRLQAQIQGPDGTVYAKGIFKLEVDIPDRYPFEPPNVKFITPVYHPNIDSGGRICHDILNMPPKGQWRPSLNIGAVLASIRVLLEEPNHDDGLMSDISAEYKHNRALFDEKARQSTERYAMQTSAERDIVSCRDIDRARAVIPQLSSSQHQSLEMANQDTLARPVLKEVNRAGASKVTLDEPSTSASGEATSSFTQVRPRQNVAAKLALTKGSTAQGVRVCSTGGAIETEPISSLSFSSENERARETEVCGPGSQHVSQRGEMNETSVVGAGKEIDRKLENAATTNALVESDRERSDVKAATTNALVESDKDGSDVKAANSIDRKAPASCCNTIDKQSNTQTFTSQSSQRTSMPGTGKRLMLPKSKLLKLSRHVPLASQSVQDSTQTGMILQVPSQVKEVAKISKEPVIILDSESDDENYVVQIRSQGVKRKHGRT